MIEFAHEEVRTRFNLLPIDEQRHWYKAAIDMLQDGYTFKIIDVVTYADKSSEVAVRIDKKLK